MLDFLVFDILSILWPLGICTQSDGLGVFKAPGLDGFVFGWLGHYFTRVHTAHHRVAIDRI